MRRGLPGIHLACSLVVAVFAVGCGNEPNPLSEHRAKPPVNTPTSGARFVVTAEDAYAIAMPYEADEPLAAFGTDYGAFFENPELVTDEQFTAQATLSISTDSVPGVEADALAVEEYANACGTRDGVSTLEAGRCEKQYQICTNRCRRLRDRRVATLCWAACMAAYAKCRRGNKGGELMR